MDERPAQRPEGALIAAALKRSRMSQRQAAAQAGISENRLRAIVHGYQTVSAGVYAPVKGPADTVARIAEVVGVTPEQLEEAGRPDVAAELRDLTQVDEPRSPMDKAEEMMAENEELARRLVARVRRLDQRKRELVEELVGMLESDPPSPPADDVSPR